MNNNEKENNIENNEYPVEKQTEKYVSEVEDNNVGFEYKNVVGKIYNILKELLFQTKDNNNMIKQL